MREDRTLQAEVMRELERNPAVDPAHIGVSVRDAAVTLTGRVSSYSERVEADQGGRTRVRRAGDRGRDAARRAGPRRAVTTP